MNKYTTPEIVENIYALGSIDWNRRIFDGISPTPIGTTYNCYLVKGSAKTALIDNIHKNYTHVLDEKLNQILGSTKLDYIIMNHAEPDHAGSTKYFLDKYGAKLITSKKGTELAGLYHGVTEDRIQIAKDGDEIDLGGKTLRFISTPFIHWPETMMTWIEEDNILFPCDFFSGHNSTGLTDNEAEDVIYWAKRYYAEIMMPLTKMCHQAMDKIANLDIKIIAPSHGPVYHHPENILSEYKKWTNRETNPKALIIYVSMYGTTDKMVLALVEKLKANGIKIQLFDMITSNAGDLAGHLLDSRAVVLASPTVLGAMHPLIQYAALLVKTFRPPTKYGLYMNNYGWGKTATKQAIEFFDQAKIENIGVVEVNGTPSEEDYANIDEAGDLLASKILKG